MKLSEPRTPGTSLTTGYQPNARGNLVWDLKDNSGKPMLRFSLRAGYETQLVKLVRNIKEHQLLEAKAQLQSLEKSRESIKKRVTYYTELLGIAD
jgi:hypothetical protein